MKKYYHYIIIFIIISSCIIQVFAQRDGSAQEDNSWKPEKYQPSNFENEDEQEENVASDAGYDLPAEKILIVQKALIDAGHICQQSGVVGKKTVRALRRYQREKGLPVTGKIDELTLRSLRIYDDVVGKKDKK